jgi:lactobin A/cerein 7B family class IIb bacteriocin
MNLENLNLVELNAQEVKETEGGFLPLLIIGAALLLSSCAAKKPLVPYNP